MMMGHRSNPRYGIALFGKFIHRRGLAFILISSIALFGRAALGVEVPAFPEAEGFGASASGGRGGDVYEVTNLEDSGPGSLRDAVSKGSRTVVFRVSGTINLRSRLELKVPNITIAGQTAPGDGICLRGHELFIADTKNVIVRFIRSRPGDESKTELDALTIWNSRDVIIDHCSLSWSTDSVNDVVKRSGNVTVQWSIIAEPLANSVHVKGAHGYGTGWDGRNGGGSYHHNLIAHCDSRSPRLGYGPGRGLIDCRNNVIYNWGAGGAYGAEDDDVNYVGNYYRPGPSSKHTDVLFTIWSPTARMFVSQNFMEDAPKVTNDNAKGIVFKQGTANDGLVPKSFEVAPIATDDPQEAFKRVIETAGAALPMRDAADKRVIDDVKNRTGKIINTPGDVGGWPELRSAPAPADGDHDGMPDAWEAKHGLNVADASDGSRIAGEDGYTNLERYLNELAEKAMATSK